MRKIPPINYHVHRFEDYDNITKIPSLHADVYKATVEAVKYGIEAKKKRVDLYHIVGTDKMISLDKDQWKGSLKTAMEYYSDLEDFESALECRQLIGKIK